MLGDRVVSDFEKISEVKEWPPERVRLCRSAALKCIVEASKRDELEEKKNRELKEELELYATKLNH